MGMKYKTLDCIYKRMIESTVSKLVACSLMFICLLELWNQSERLHSIVVWSLQVLFDWERRSFPRVKVAWKFIIWRTLFFHDFVFAFRRLIKVENWFLLLDGAWECKGRNWDFSVFLGPKILWDDEDKVKDYFIRGAFGIESSAVGDESRILGESLVRKLLGVEEKLDVSRFLWVYCRRLIFCISELVDWIVILL